MWLLNTTTLRLQNFQADPPDYVILSHTWGNEEVSYEDMQGKQKAVRKRQGYLKIVGCCKQATRDGFDWAWVDTCCIDKRSSAELSEAINSMYQWYWRAAICYVYLSDVQVDDTKQTFMESRWFTRGWTLQELLAPAVVEFYAQSWHSIGSKTQNVRYIQEATNIDRIYVQDRETIQKAGIATKFSWASRRQTTRIEDAAYCLLGLVQVNMPMLYGEGKRAFHRLQLELLRKKSDHTILAWNHPNVKDHISGVLAPSVSYFQHAAMSRKIETSSADEIDVTNHGLKVTLRCSPSLTGTDLVALLHCKDRWNRPLALELECSDDRNHYRRRRLFHMQDWNEDDGDDLGFEVQPRILFLDIDEDYNIEELENREVLIALANISPTRDYSVNGITVSTYDKVRLERRTYDRNNSFNTQVGLEQLKHLHNMGLSAEDRVTCVRIGSDRWKPTYQAIIYGLYGGRPMVHYTTNTQDLFSKNWHRLLRQSPSQYIRDHVRFTNEQHTIEIKAKKVRWEEKFVWILKAKAFTCTCSPEVTGYECICTATQDDSEASQDTQVNERGVWNRLRQRARHPNTHLQEAASLERHIVECSCYQCATESKMEVCPTHLVECDCWECRREGRIEIRPLYCDFKDCEVCDQSREMAAVARRRAREEFEFAASWYDETKMNHAFFSR